MVGVLDPVEIDLGADGFEDRGDITAFGLARGGRRGMAVDRDDRQGGGQADQREQAADPATLHEGRRIDRRHSTRGCEG